MKLIKEFETIYYKGRIYEGNIFEIEYKVSRLEFLNTVSIDNSVRRNIKELAKETGKKVILILNLKNLKYINSTAIGATISAWDDLRKTNGKETLIYCINLNNKVLKTYKLLKLDHKILLFDFDSIEDIYEIEKAKGERGSHEDT